MPLRIRSKFIGILLIAAVFPLLVALVAIEVLGYRYYRNERGRLLEATANFIAVSISHNLVREIEKFADWINLAHVNTAAAGIIRDTNSRHVETSSLLTNQLAIALREFQNVTPLFTEIVAWDEHGVPLAGTRLPSNASVTNQPWWSRVTPLRPGRLYIEGPTLDVDARTCTMMICTRVTLPTTSSSLLIMAMLDANPLFAAIPSTVGGVEPSREVIDGAGRVWFELYSRYERRLGERIAAPAVPAVTAPTPGWTLAVLGDRERELVGFSPIRIESPLLDYQLPSRISPLFVIAHDDVKTVLAPVRRQLWLLAASGLVLILVFTGVGYYIATRKIIGPLEQLREAARALARLAQRRAISSPSELPANPAAREVLNNLHAIRTGDEISDLATDFREMARRVLTYHERLEDAIAEQTAVIQQDLQFAREFQETLMPRDYPYVVGHAPDHAIHLEFHHIYQPASSVGGDFFDVLKLADNRAGVFIADVMGHGARSALVTAILRTLLQDLSAEGQDPARFLRVLNQHFARVASPSDPVIFVSALYLILDADARTATLASAGHPAPFMGRRRLGTVHPLYDRLQNNPALGLFPDSDYTNLTHSFEAGDVFVLFTDGVYEAGNLTGEQFGRDRLQEAIAQNLHRGVQEICRGVVERIRLFTGNGALPDDICIVGVEACANRVVSTATWSHAPR